MMRGVLCGAARHLRTMLNSTWGISRQDRKSFRGIFILRAPIPISRSPPHSTPSFCGTTVTQHRQATCLHS